MQVTHVISIASLLLSRTMKLSTSLAGLALALSLATLQAQPNAGGGKDGGKDGGKGGGGGGGSSTQEYAALLPGECEICNPTDNRVRPVSLTIQYFGGKGEVSRYQDLEHATCRDQMFPESGTITAYGITYTVEEGTPTIITFVGDAGKMDAETDFYFSDGSAVSGCFIHTSCSQPIVAGDQIGPFLILEGNECTGYCGDGSVDTSVGEECDEGATMPSEKCREDCTTPRCGDGILDSDMGEECDDGAAMPTDTCQDCELPFALVTFCGDGIVDPLTGEECDDGAANGDDTDGCRDDCTIPSCGDGVHDSDMGEECDDGANGDDTDGCRDDCTSPSCGDGVHDSDMGEECDDGANGDDTDGCRDDCTIPSCGDGIVDMGMGEECDDGAAFFTCRDDCTMPYCGDGIVDTIMGEECDDGANGVADGCKDDCKTCVCEASATYEESTGAVTIDFDMCGEEPLKSDFIGIYPCDASTTTVTADHFCSYAPATCGASFDLGYEEGEVYVNQNYLWFAFTCGSPAEYGCQRNHTMEWPSSGTVTIDPNVAGINWAFRSGRTLEPGCYKAVLNRDINVISPPPYPTICEPWGDALEFQVPVTGSSGNGTSSEATPLEYAQGESGSLGFSQGAQGESGSLGISQGAQGESGSLAFSQGAQDESGSLGFSAYFAFLASVLALFFI
jgi:hypothetical protein